MGRKSTISRLPPEIKSAIEGHLADGRLTLVQIIEALHAQFPKQAAQGTLPSRSAVQRYGPKLERRLIAVKAFTEAAGAIDAHAKDPGDSRSAALTAIVQQELFDAMINLGDATDPDVDPADRIAMLSAAAKNIATLARSSVNTKQYQAKIAAEARAELLAEQEVTLQEVAKAQGMDAAQVDFWRQKFLGIKA
jgi:hypothetical protein